MEILSVTSNKKNLKRNSVMPKLNEQKQVEFTITMSPEEALWLKTKLQNPTGPEGSEEYGMRLGFFSALPSIPTLQALQE